MRIIDTEHFENLSTPQRLEAISLLGDGLEGKSKQFGFAIADRLFHVDAEPTNSINAQFSTLLQLELSDLSGKLLALPDCPELLDLAKEEMQLFFSSQDDESSGFTTSHAFNAIRWIIDQHNPSIAEIMLGEAGAAVVSRQQDSYFLVYYHYEDLTRAARFFVSTDPDLIDHACDGFTDLEVSSVLPKYEKSIKASKSKPIEHAKSMLAVALSCIDRATLLSTVAEQPETIEAAAKFMILPRY